MAAHIAPQTLLVKARFAEPDEELTGRSSGRKAHVLVRLDLARVYRIQEIPDFDTGVGQPGRCAVYTSEREKLLVEATFKDVDQAFQAWTEQNNVRVRVLL